MQRMGGQQLVVQHIAYDKRLAVALRMLSNRYSAQRVARVIEVWRSATDSWVQLGAFEINGALTCRAYRVDRPEVADSR